MLGIISVYNPNEHTIVGGDISHFCNRMIEGDPQRWGHLFVVRYIKLGVFCICEWTDNHKDTFTDVLNLGKSLGNFGYKEAQKLRKRILAPVTAEETSRAIISNDSDFYHNLQDEDMEESERRERVAIGE